MDHRPYDYSAPAQRARSVTAGNASASFVLLLTHGELRAPDNVLRDPRMVREFGSITPDDRRWCQRQYDLRPVIAANAMALQHPHATPDVRWTTPAPILPSH